MDNFHIFQGSGFLRPLSLLLIFSGIFLNAAIVSGVLVYGWGPLLLPPLSLFLSTLFYIWIHSPVLHITWKWVPLCVSVQNFLVPYVPWSLLAMRIQYMFLWLWSLLHLLDCVVCPRIPFPLVSMVSRGAPVSVALYHMGCFLTVFLVCFSLSFVFLAHESHPYSKIVFHIYRGCQYFLATDCHVLQKSGICPDLQLHYFLAFTCHTFFFIDYFFICAFLLLLPCAPNRSGLCIPFSVFSPSNLLMSSSLSFCFSSYNLTALLCHFSIAFLFPLVSRGPNGLSLHLLIFPWFGGISTLFQCCCIFSGIPFFVFCWSFFNQFPYCWFFYCG